LRLLNLCAFEVLCGDESLIGSFHELAEEVTDFCDWDRVPLGLKVQLKEVAAAILL
jgi:hypothetical protein